MRRHAHTRMRPACVLCVLTALARTLRCAPAQGENCWVFVDESAIQDTVKHYFKFEEDLFTAAKKAAVKNQEVKPPTSISTVVMDGKLLSPKDVSAGAGRCAWPRHLLHHLHARAHGAAAVACRGAVRRHERAHVCPRRASPPPAAAQLKACEKLPSKKQLLATIAMLTKQPATKIAKGIKQVPTKLAVALRLVGAVQQLLRAGGVAQAADGRGGRWRAAMAGSLHGVARAHGAARAHPPPLATCGAGVRTGR